MTSKIDAMLQDVKGQPVDNRMLEDALGQIATKFKLDPKTVSDVKNMATRVLSGESIKNVIA